MPEASTVKIVPPGKLPNGDGKTVVTVKFNQPAPKLGWASRILPENRESNLLANHASQAVHLLLQDYLAEGYHISRHVISKNNTVTQVLDRSLPELLKLRRAKEGILSLIVIAQRDRDRPNLDNMVVARIDFDQAKRKTLLRSNTTLAEAIKKRNFYALVSRFASVLLTAKCAHG